MRFFHFDISMFFRYLQNSQNHVFRKCPKPDAGPICDHTLKFLNTNIFHQNIWKKICIAPRFLLLLRKVSPLDPKQLISRCLTYVPGLTPKPNPLRLRRSSTLPRKQGLRRDLWSHDLYIWSPAHFHENKDWDSVVVSVIRTFFRPAHFHENKDWDSSKYPLWAISLESSTLPREQGLRQCESSFTTCSTVSSTLPREQGLRLYSSPSKVSDPEVQHPSTKTRIEFP